MNAPLGLPGNGPIQRFERREAFGFLPRGYIDGLILSNDTTDATNDIAISAGVCRSTVNVIDGVASTRARDQMDMEIPVGIIKQLDVAWAPENYDDEGYSGGDRSGGRSASAISNTTWHTFVIGGPGLPPDVMFHDSATQSSIVAALPSGYTAYRMIASVMRASAAILPFTQTDDLFLLTTPVLDISNATPGTTANTGTLGSVPTGLKLLAMINIVVQTSVVYLSALDQTDSAGSGSSAPLSSFYDNANQVGGQLLVRTSTAAQFRYRCGGNQPFYAATLGWWHPRGRNA
jgi:hypothetical protein